MNDPLLLIRFDFGKDINLGSSGAQRILAHPTQIVPGEQARIRQTDLLPHVRRYKRLISRHDLQRHAKPLECPHGLGNAGLGRVGENQQTEKGHSRLVLFGDMLESPHVPAG